jgi:hypothetical protein
MTEPRRLDQAEVARLLGASRTVTLPLRPGGSPLEALPYVMALQRGARIEGAPVTYHQTIAVAEESWNELEKLASELAGEGQEVDPFLLARILLERGIADLRASRKDPP